MVLSGKAKTDYQREYMRRRRKAVRAARASGQAPATLAGLQARIRELEAELAHERKRHAATPVSNAKDEQASKKMTNTAQAPKAEATGPRRPSFKYDPGWRKAFERLLTATDLPGHAEIAALHETLIDLDARKAPLDKITFRKGLGLLHSDRLHAYPGAYERHHKLLDRLGDYFRKLRKPFKVDAKGLTPEQKAKRAATRARNEAFKARWAGVRVPMPEKLTDWAELKRKATEARRAKRAASQRQ